MTSKIRLNQQTQSLEDQLKQLDGYIKEWNLVNQQWNNWKCKLPIIGLYFQNKVLKELARLTKQQEDFNKRNF